MSVEFQITIDIKPWLRAKRSLEHISDFFGPDKVRKRVRSGDLHPLKALDLLNRQRLAGGKPSEALERWCEMRWQKKRCLHGRRSVGKSRTA